MSYVELSSVWSMTKYISKLLVSVIQGMNLWMNESCLCDMWLEEAIIVSILCDIW